MPSPQSATSGSEYTARRCVRTLSPENSCTPARRVTCCPRASSGMSKAAPANVAWRPSPPERVSSTSRSTKYSCRQALSRTSEALPSSVCPSVPSLPFHFSSPRSEEHTSELQSLMRISYAVFCLKKKKKQHKQIQDKKESKKKKHNRI